MGDKAMNDDLPEAGMSRLLLFGGKGGVGKTSCATSTSIWLADCGFKVLLVSSDPAHSTSDSLDVQLSDEPSPVEGVDGLQAFELDPESRMNELLPRLSESLQGGFGGRLEAFLGAQASAEFTEGVSNVDAGELLLPGLDEALAIDRLLTHLEDPEFDIVIFDTAPTGHTLRFLSLPELLERWSARIARMIRASGGLKTLLLGRKQEAAIRDELDRFSERVGRARSILSDPLHTGFILVTIPEKMAVAETVRAAEALSGYGINVEAVIINRVTPDFDHPFLIHRREVEQEHVQKLRSHFGNLAVAEVPLEAGDVHGLNSLREMGERLHGPPEDASARSGEFFLGLQIPLRMNLN